MPAEKKAKGLSAAKKTAMALAKSADAAGHNKAVDAIVIEKKSEAKTRRRMAEVKPEIVVQYREQESDMKDLAERVKRDYIDAGYKASSLKSMRIYVKPEDNAAYYVINDKVLGHIQLFKHN